MDSRYYIVVIDILFMFVVILTIALMSVAFEDYGDDNSNFNSIEVLDKTNSDGQVNEHNYVVLELFVDKISVSQVTPTKRIFIKHYYDIKSFSESPVYSRSYNFVLYDDRESPFLGGLIRTLNTTGKKIIIAR